VLTDYGCGAGALVSGALGVAGTAGTAGVAGVSAALAGAVASASELELDCGLQPIKATTVNRDRMVSLVFMCFLVLVLPDWSRLNRIGRVHRDRTRAGSVFRKTGQAGFVPAGAPRS
jgi:hypothetical protein